MFVAEGVRHAQLLLHPRKSSADADKFRGIPTTWVMGAAAPADVTTGATGSANEG